MGHRWSSVPPNPHLHFFLSSLPLLTPPRLPPRRVGWTSQLVARKSGAGHGSLGADDDLPRKETPEYILLWRNTPKPAAPFNLSPFAVTLNDVPVGLKELLPPTDCRLRPDQRAFENADVRLVFSSRPLPFPPSLFSFRDPRRRTTDILIFLCSLFPSSWTLPWVDLTVQYDRANDLKNAQEAKQRETRRKREQGLVPPHEPRWFVRSIDPDTKDQVWEPKRTAVSGGGNGVAGGEIEYWAERSRAAKEGRGEWRGVGTEGGIFVDEEGK